MELYQLKTFVMVAEEEHLTRAAKRLNASQPAVSAHIKTLEGELGINLFTRTPKGMALTPEGIQLKKYADKVLGTVNDMMVHATTLRGTISGELRLGVHTEPDSLRIPELFSTLQAQYPYLQLHLLQSMTGEAVDRLESKEIDAAYIYGNLSSEKIFSMELQQLKLIVAGPAEWRGKLESADPKSLEHFPWIMTPDDCPFHNVASQLFRKYNISPDQVATTDQEAVIKTMVKAKVGLSLLLERDTVQQSIQNEFAIWDKEDLTLPLSVVCLESRKNELLLKILISLLSGVWRPTTH